MLMNKMAQLTDFFLQVSYFTIIRHEITKERNIIHYIQNSGARKQALFTRHGQ